MVERLHSHIPATCAHMRHVFATCSEYYVRTWKSDVDKLALRAALGPDRGDYSDHDCTLSEGFQGIMHRKKRRNSSERGVHRCVTVIGETNRRGAACFFHAPLEVWARHNHMVRVPKMRHRGFFFFSRPTGLLQRSDNVM